MVDLSQFENDYKTAPAQREQHDGDYPAIPDGKYSARVGKVEIKTTASTGKPYLNWGLVILGGPYANQYLWRKNFLSTAQNIQFLKQDLELCGLHLTRLNDINDPLVIRALVGVELEVTKKTKGEFENIYLNRVLGAGEAPLASAPRNSAPPWAGQAGTTGEPPVPTWADDDVPF